MCQSVLTDNVKAEQKTSGRSLGSNVAKLVSGKMATQVIAFATAPVLARLYSPDSFGVLQIFASMAGVIGIVSCLRYELSVPLGRDEKEAAASFVLSLVFAFAFTLIVLAIVPIAKGKVSQWFSSPELKAFLWILPIIVFLNGAGRALRFWAAREERFGGIAWSNFSRTSGNVLTAIVYALVVGSSVIGLFMGYFAETVLGILVLLIFLNKKLLFDIRNSNLSFSDLKATAIRYKKFPGFDTWSGLLNSLSVQSPAILLGLLFSKTVVGYYSLGYRFVSLPLSLLGGSISQVFFPAAAKEYNESGSLSEMVRNIFRRLIQIGSFPMVMSAFLGAPLFGFVFGEKWIEAGIYVQILSAWIFVVFITSPFGTVFAILERQGTGLVFNIGLISSRILALLLGGRLGGPRLALAAFAIVSLVGWSAVLYWILRNCRVSLRWVVETLLGYIIFSSLLLLPAGCLAWSGMNMLFISPALLVAAVIYTYNLYHSDSGFRIAIANIMATNLRFGRWGRRGKSL